MMRKLREIQGVLRAKYFIMVCLSEGEESSDSSVGTDFEDDDISEQGQADDVDAELEEEEDTPASSSFILNTPHRGVQLRLPDIQLTSISLLTCTSLSLQLRCIRCKTDVDVHSLTSTRRFPCIKCSTMLSVTFRPTPVHAESKIWDMWMRRGRRLWICSRALGRLCVNAGR
ncbi:hypothetical protein BC829DRAFT_182861 [Chytridium lagenaria]|nr:hypothetical protein BC829DRAFT_182861 [Chytridium lagenaria]